MIRALALAAVLAAAPARADDCDAIGVWRDGHETGQVCRADVAASGLTVIDLRDEWVPPVLADGPKYADTYRALAQERFDDAGGDGNLAKHDRYLELFGISPALSVVRSRLADDARIACHAAIAPPLTIRTAQAHLACDGLFEDKPQAGKVTWATTSAIARFQRGVMLLPTGKLDADTRAQLALPADERDFQTARRVLRERVAAAAGLLADGTAGADDVSPATDAAAAALGWTDPAGVRAWLTEMGPREVAIALPPARLPVAFEIEVDIDPGDRTHRPSLVVYAVAEAREPVVRWPTTFGGWQDEVAGDAIVRRFKASPRGPRIWRDLYVGPTWLPPASTPDRELLRAGKLAREALGPSYRAAFGMLAFVHLIEDGADTWDQGIRTHATGNLTSLATGASHGCHRLLGFQAVRLADFVLAHHAFVRHGDAPTYYRRTVRSAAGAELPVKIDTLGYRIELVPPIAVNVLARTNSPAPPSR